VREIKSNVLPPAKAILNITLFFNSFYSIFSSFSVGVHYAIMEDSKQNRILQNQNAIEMQRDASANLQKFILLYI